MEMDKNILSRIKEILKSNPRGMNVTEIVGEIKMNRQSVSKYLEMLVMSGHVDVRNFGPSKVYYLSQRLPVSAMLSLSYGFIIVLDKMLNIINVNDHFLEFVGVKREDMMYKSFEKFAFPIEFEPSIMPEVRGALDGKESSIEAFYKRKGSESYFDVRFIPMVMDDGEKGVAIFFEDITDRKRWEEELRIAHAELEARVRDRTMELEVANKALTKEIDQRIKLNHALMDSQRTLETLISNLPGIAYRCKNDEHWTMDFISHGSIDIIGYKPEDLIGNSRISYEEIVHPDDRDMIRRQIQAAIDLNEPFNLTYRIVTAPGKIRRVNEQGRAVFSHDGKLVDIEGYISDITDLIDMKVSRDQSEAKYRALVENISDGIWELDKDLKFVYMSPRIFDIIGFKPEDAIGKTPYDMMLPEERKRMKQALAPLHKTPKPFSFLKCCLRHKNGSRVMVDINGIPFFNEHHELQGYRGVTRKIAP